jgi:hypothetical protein
MKLVIMRSVLVRWLRSCLNALRRRQWAFSQIVCGVDEMKVSRFYQGFPRRSSSNGTILGVHVAGNGTPQVCPVQSEFLSE